MRLKLPEFSNTACSRCFKALKFRVSVSKMSTPCLVAQNIWSTCDNICIRKILIHLLKMPRWTVQGEWVRKTELGLKYVPFLRFLISAVKRTSNKRESITVNIVQNSHYKSNPEEMGPGGGSFFKSLCSSQTFTLLLCLWDLQPLLFQKLITLPLKSLIQIACQKWQ